MKQPFKLLLVLPFLVSCQINGSHYYEDYESPPPVAHVESPDRLHHDNQAANATQHGHDSNRDENYSDSSVYHSHGHD